MPARAVIIATGVQYRRLAVENLAQFEGAGVYYGATFVEAQLCGGEDVIVVGGGNSAGQAAVFLAQTARRVHMLVRSAGLAESMSRYLIRRIEENRAIELQTHTEIVALEGRRSARARALAEHRHRCERDQQHRPRVRHDRRGAEHRAGSTAASRSTRTASSRPDPISSRGRSRRPRAGRWRGRRICSRPACRASSRSATCAAATSSGWRRPSARDRSPSPSSTRCCSE